MLGQEKSRKKRKCFYTNQLEFTDNLQNTFCEFRFSKARQ